MKLSTLSLVVASVVTTSSAFPTPIPDPTHVPVSQDPSPPRPFPAGRVVEVKDPSPPRPFPKYAPEGGNGLEERDPSALSRFPTDENKEASDPSPPRPFPFGHLVNVSPPLEERNPSAPHKLVKVGTATVDPSPPRPFPKYPLDGENTRDDGKLLEEREPLSRFPTGGSKEAADPSPPRPFPAGPVEVVRHHGEGHSEGSKVVANDPSPPRPFPAGRLVEVKPASPNDTVSARSPSPLLRTVNGSAAEASDPSPPRPFPAGHAVGVEPRGEMAPPSRAHGGYFPPSNPPVERTAPALEADRPRLPPLPCPDRCPRHLLDCCFTIGSDTQRPKPRVMTQIMPAVAYSNPTHTSSASSSSALPKGHGPWRTVYTSGHSSSTSTSVVSAPTSASSAISASASSVSSHHLITSTSSTPSRVTTISASPSTSTSTTTATSTSTSTSTSTHTYTPRRPTHTFTRRLPTLYQPISDIIPVHTA